MVTLVNRAKVGTSTTGTGTITLGSAVDGYQTFADAGVVDTDVVRYVIEDGTAWEIGTGTYTASGTTLSRTVSESSNADAAINLSGEAVVYVTAAAADIVQPSDLATVATTGSYNDLSDQPTLYSDASVDAHLNTGTASSGEVLSWTGTDYDWIAAGGGASYELYAENPSSPTAPSATGTNAVAIGSNTTATGTNAFALGLGDGDATATSAFAVGGQSSNTSSIAIGTSSRASGFKSVSIGADSDATGSRAVALGANAQAVDTNAVALGNSRAGQQDSFAAAIASNTSSYGATGANSVAIGYQAKATAFSGFAFGYQNQSTANYAVTVGRNNVGSSQYSLAIGYEASTRATSSIAFSTGSFSGIAGQHQISMFAFRQRTTDATPTLLLTDGGTTGSTNDQIILPNNAAFAFHGIIVARQQASQGTASAAWRIEGLIRREGSAGTTVLVNSAITVIDNTPSWGLALSADTTNGGLAITGTGAASTNIAWNGNIHTSEVTY